MDNIKGVKKFNSDGWLNIYTQMGVQGMDKSTGMTFKKGLGLSESYLNALYSDEGIIRKAIDRAVMDMMKEGFYFDGDEEGALLSYYKERGFAKEIKRQLTWDRLHGGALLLIGLEDGKDLDKPVNFNQIKSILYIKSYERWRVVPDQNSVVENPRERNFGLPEYYDIYPSSGTPFKVHYSRVFISDGLDITDDMKEYNGGVWGDSVVQGVKRYVERFAHSYECADSILDDFVQSVLSISNLQELIASGEEEEIKKRLQILSLGKNQLQTMLIAEGEQYTKQSSSVSGLSNVMQEFAKGLASVLNMPVTLLMGVSPAGMNSTGESDLTLWYDFVSWLQDEKLEPILIWLNRFIVSEKENSVNVQLKDIKVRFNPILKPSKKEQAEAKKINAEADSIYEEMGVLHKSEIRKSRFNEKGDYSHDIMIDLETDEINELEEEDLTEEEKEALNA